MNDTSPFAELLRDWRRRRGLSQLELAQEAGVSQRHLSFLELGRSTPSRGMVLRLGAALDIPLREQNSLLLAAGHAPVWQNGSIGGASSEMVDRALDYMLERHDPYPAFVLDRHWHLLRANSGGAWFAGILTDGPPVVPDPAQPVNLADALMAPAPMRQTIANWPEVARYFLRTVRSDYLADGTEETRALFERMLQYPGTRALYEEVATDLVTDPVMTIDVRYGGRRLRVFTTLATLGTPTSVAAQEIRIEYFFPADAESEEFLKSAANG